MNRSHRYSRPSNRRPARRYCGLCGQGKSVMSFDPGSNICALCRSRREARQ
ncbi:hypothetical protein R5R73_04805 [Salinicola sp. LHM]|uniref:hypothetical protein n=1 Tax=Salinicola sp. LHM TaxID=3065298 RepID=UPI002ACDDB83|nr:hypothetical protein [Salinicola sp. LHM]WQH34009.1 hypothetical protein R5R73_04805 [Salinicola sp. LHM]